MGLQLKQFGKAIERSKLSQMHSTAEMAGELNDVSQDIQEVPSFFSTPLRIS